MRDNEIINDQKDKTIWYSAAKRHGVRFIMRGSKAFIVKAES